MSEPDQTWDPAAKAGDLFLVIRWELGRGGVATFLVGTVPATVTVSWFLASDDEMIMGARSL